MRASSTIALILFYTALVLVGVLIDAPGPNRGVLLAYVVSQLSFWSGLLFAAMLTAPAALLIVAQYQTSRVQQCAYENSRLRGDAQRLVTTLAEIGKFQLGVSRRTAEATHDIEAINAIETLGEVLKASETDVVAIEKLLADPSQYKILIDGVRERQLAVTVKLTALKALLAPIQTSADDVRTAQQGVEELLENFGGAEEIAALSTQVKAAESYLAGVDAIITTAASAAGPAKQIVAALKAAKERLEHVTDEDHGINALIQNIDELVDDIKREVRRAELTESGEIVPTKVAATQAALQLFITRIQHVETCVETARTLRATAEKAKGRLSVLTDEHGPKNMLRKIEEALKTFEQSLKAVEGVDGVPLTELIAKNQGRVEGLANKVASYEANYGLITKLLASTTALEARLGATATPAKNGEARTT